PQKSGSFSFPPQIPLRGPIPRTRHRQVPLGTVDQRFLGEILVDTVTYRPWCEIDDKLNEARSGPGSYPDEAFELFADVDAFVLDELLNTLK
uniref:Uncharacterized protein n=1 Tax=Cannabis sativa TaxID=3483 RepID=A0A803P418_CANSA